MLEALGVLPWEQYPPLGTALPLWRLLLLVDLRSASLNIASCVSIRSYELLPLPHMFLVGRFLSPLFSCRPHAPQAPNDSGVDNALTHYRSSITADRYNNI